MRRERTPPFEEPDPNLVANLKLEVRESYRAGRWMWQRHRATYDELQQVFEESTGIDVTLDRRHFDRRRATSQLSSRRIIERRTGLDRRSTRDDVAMQRRVVVDRVSRRPRVSSQSA